MFTDKMNRITSEFAARIFETLRAASLAELAARGRAAPRPAPKKAAAKAPAKKPVAAKPVAAKPVAAKPVAAKPVVATKTPPAKPVAVKKAPPAKPDHLVTAAALSFFAERGGKGATADQVSARLEELGLPSRTDVIDVLTQQGSIRDAGFRRSTGTGNKTSPVYVSA